ncbi:Geranylgeranyl transferase type-2 subunit alpha [Colletotrichum sidae]|uniref:Geranylgeranyl transferase type-2 subunit alpha n=1 Tax=Colletotrichum sidae TaxID=1347389 RepID=A0A4R8T2N7_9PEZI|nr:Geranylgeranyl transferase type-2 subunit alpha [Colletotrichum sidae]
MDNHGVARTARKPRTETQLQADLAKINTLRSLEDALLRAKPDPSDPQTLALTTKLLRLNPEHYTAWNTLAWVVATGAAREFVSSMHSFSVLRRLVALFLGHDPARPRVPSGPREEQKKSPWAEEVVGTLKSELTFTIPLLLEFPKSYWIWKYRSWLLQQAIDLLPKPIARSIWEEELGLVSKMLTKDRRNFHAWGYRRRVVAVLESAALDGQSMVEPEFEYTTKMINVDLSNFSAWHNRTNLIPRLLEEREADDAARQRFLDDELELVKNALNVGPEDQSLWFYHQFLILNLTEDDGRPRIAPHLSRQEKATYVQREIEDIKELLEDYDDMMGIYKALLDYTRALAKLEDRALMDEETEDLGTWMAKVRELDPMRSGRWADLEKACGLV